MSHTVFQHLRHTPNVGDLACSPGNYLDFGPSEARDFSAPVPPCDLLVLGGGQVFNQCADAVVTHGAAARHKVIWGVGISETQQRGLMFDIIAPHCALIGCRDWGRAGCDYVPCASLLSPLFDAAPAPETEVVCFWHARKSGSVAAQNTYPSRDNHDISMAEAIAHMARGETVVSNSYHGTLWAMALGRKVLCVPFSDKFNGFREPPVMAAPEDWPSALGRAERRDILEEARAANHVFYEKVRSL